MSHAGNNRKQVNFRGENPSFTRGVHLTRYHLRQVFALTFQPSGIKIMDTLDSIKALPRVSDEMRKLGEGAIPYDGGLYPWEWVEDDAPNFRKLQGGLLVAPILQKLILNREPQKVLDWADKVAAWPFKRIIPCHLANDLKADGKAFRRAFNFLQDGGGARDVPVGDSRDVELLANASRTLTQQGVLFPEAPLVKKAKRAGSGWW